MRFSCPHCGEPAARPLAPNGVEDTDPDVHAGATWRCSKCHKPVVIEPQTPEERREVFAALEAIVIALAELRDKVMRATLEARP